MTAFAILVVAVVLAIVLPSIWICRANRKVYEDYAKRWSRLNEKVGGVLPPYSEVRKKGEER